MSAVKLMRHIGLAHSLMPMTGRMDRNLDGSKDKKGVYPPPNFLEKAAQREHEEVYEHTKHFAIVSGVKNDEGRQLVSIDTDIRQATERALKLVEMEYPNYHFIWHSFFHSYDKDEFVRAKILFWATEEFLEAFPKNEFIQESKVDVLTNHTVYCPCENNGCAQPWEWDGTSEIQDIPSSMVAWLKLIRQKAEANKKSRTAEEILRSEQVEGFQCEALEKFVATGDLTKDLRNVWFRHPEYRVNGRKNGQPLFCVSEIPDHIGNKFLMEVNGIMAMDCSVTKELAVKVHKKINQIWGEKGLGSKKDEDLQEQIIKPGVLDAPKWVYDPHWKKKLETSCRFMDKSGDEWEIFTDSETYQYTAVCRTGRKVRHLENSNAISEFIFNRTNNKKFERINQIRDMEFIARISDKFGETSEGNFNVFQQNEFLDCMQNPEKYAEGRRKPDAFLLLCKLCLQKPEYIDKFLRHITTYFRTGKGSTLIFFFTGAPGSGKTKICSVLSTIMGAENCISFQDIQQFLDPYDAKLRNKYVVLLEEIGGQLKGGQFKGELKDTFYEKLKAYSTASPKAHLNAKFVTDSIPYLPTWLFLCATNETDLKFPPNDRRSIVFESRCHLLDSEEFAQWKKDNAEEIGDEDPAEYFIETRLEDREALLDLCYYLTTTYPEDLTGSAWNRRWITEATIKMTKGDAIFQDQFKVWLENKDWVSIYKDAVYNKEPISDIFVHFRNREGLYMPVCAIEKLYAKHQRNMDSGDIKAEMEPLFGACDESDITAEQSPLNSHKRRIDQEAKPPKRMRWYAFKVDDTATLSAIKEQADKERKEEHASDADKSSQPLQAEEFHKTDGDYNAK